LISAAGMGRLESCWKWGDYGDWAESLGSH